MYPLDRRNGRSSEEEEEATEREAASLLFQSEWRGESSNPGSFYSLFPLAALCREQQLGLVLENRHCRGSSSL
jgi:hypothetical protein